MSDIEKIIQEFSPEKNFGYIKDEIKDEDYVLGNLQLPTDVLQPTGQWDAFIPADEIQRNEKYETYNCTAFGTLNALEFLFKRIFGESRNWSERYTGICAGTKPPGNSPQVVIESIRKDAGLLDDEILPMSKANTLEEYYSPNPIPWLLKENGRKFLNNYKVWHEWVFSDNQTLNIQNCLKDALRFSPLGIAVYAWQQDSKSGYYVRPNGKEDNHWCVLFGYADQTYWQVFDSYDSTIKHLEWNYSFDRAKRYHIEKITTKSFLQSIKNYFLNLIK